MTSFNVRRELLNGAALAILGGLALFGASDDAHASTFCTADMTTAPDTFNCVETAVASVGIAAATAPSVAATGSYTEGALLSPNDGLYITSSGPLDVVFSEGQIDTPGDWRLAVYLDSSSGTDGALTYTSNGIASSTGSGVNTRLIGTSVTASTGTVLATATTTTGVWSTATNGMNSTTGGTTIVEGTHSTGLGTFATNGDNITNSGTIDAPALGSIGIRATTLAGTSCGTNTVNVTGNITGAAFGIYAKSCGAGNVNVMAGTSVSRAVGGATNIYNLAQGTATTIIDGEVSAPSAGEWAIWLWGSSTITVLRSSAALTGAVATSDGSDSFILDPGAIWDTGSTSYFGFGDDVVNSAGIIRAESGATRFDDLELLTNTGSIDLQDGSADDVLTISGAYTGSGAVILIDAVGPTSDQLVIGGNASGTTHVIISGGRDVIDTDGLLVVDADTATSNAFILSDATVTRLIDYRLVQSGGNFVLFATPNATAFQPLAVGNITQDLWYQSAEVYRSSSRHRGADDLADRTNGVGLWGQLHGGRDRYGNQESRTVFGAGVDIDNRVRADRRGAQVGIDFIPTGGGLVAGLTSGYQTAQADHRSLAGGIEAKGYNLGAYLQVGGSAGFYGGILVKHDKNEVHLTNSAFDLADGDPDSRSTGVEGVGGFRWNSGSLALDLGAGMSFVRTTVEDFSAEGIEYDFATSNGVRGELRARVGLSGGLAPFVDASLFRDFAGGSKMTMLSDDESESVNADGRSTWGRLAVGLGGSKLPAFGGWAEFGSRKGIGLSAGLRF